MKHTTGSFEGMKGCRLFYQAWLPEGTPRAILAIVPGSGDHCGRYQNLVEGLVPAGYAVAGYDHRGFGRSGGRRGHIDSWDEYRGDLRLFLDLAGRLLPGLPLFLYGYSHGSLVVLDYVLRHADGLSGAILVGTGIEPAAAAPAWQVLLAKALSPILPTFSARVAFEASSLSRDPQVVKACKEDPLWHWKRSARFASETLKVIDWIRNRPGEIRLPVLFLHGELDPLVKAAGVRRFFEQIPYPDKAIHVYPGALHELHNDLDHEQVVNDVARWIAAHL